MFAAPLDFPSRTPSAYARLEDEPAFDPAAHLALEPPARTWSLEDLGYDAETRKGAPSGLAFTAPFRLLTEAGAAATQQVARRLQAHTWQTGELEDFESNRNQTYLAGGVYRSRFLRDLCGSPDVAAFLSELAGAPIGPHSLPSQQLYINYAPPRIEDHVDIWHADSVAFDYVLMASDPSALRGGEFEIFLGTRQEAAALAGTADDHLNRGIGEVIPQDRVVSFRFPACGYALFQQGNYVVHRAKRLLEPGERMTLVPGYVPLDMSVADCFDMGRLATYGEPGVAGEVLRHGAWRTKAKLERVIETLDLDGDIQAQRESLRAALEDAQRALDATREA